MTGPMFRCGHARTPDNLRKIGKGRVACRECRRRLDAKYQGRDPSTIRTYSRRQGDGEYSASYLARWRDRGGYEGALARQTEPFRPCPTRAAVGHIPFPGHRHMGEVR